MPDEELGRRIGRIGNRAGALVVREESGQFFWGIEDTDGTSWEEIPQALFLGLLAFEHLGAYAVQ